MGSVWIAEHVELETDVALKLLRPELNARPADVERFRRALTASEQACGEKAGPLAAEPLGGRFRWLTAPRSTIVQTGPVHAGLTADPEAELERLFGVLVRL